MPDSPTATEAWQQLEELARDLPELRSMLDEPERFARNLVSAPHMHIDFSRQRWNPAIRAALIALAQESGACAAREQLFQDNRLNATEDRAVLHTALRRPVAETLEAGGVDLLPAVHAAITRAVEFADALRCGAWRGATGKAISQVVNIGIGGSSLGPALVCDALEPSASPGPEVHFLTNVDGHEANALLATLDPERTLFIVASKSFGTLETRVNADSARCWFLERGGTLDGIARHFVAVSTNLEAAAAFGLPAENLFPLWDWVGGRFSLWSPIGLPIAIRHGGEAFRALLDGAREMDDHFRTAPPIANAPLMLALAEIWNTNFIGTRSLAVLPYASALERLPDYLQQLEMESNGKAVHLNGGAVDHHTAPVLWGNVGTNGQHAYHQLLHQGTEAFSAEFVVTLRCRHRFDDHHRWLVAHCFAQAEAFARGRGVDEVAAALEADGMTRHAALDAARHRAIPGGHPSTMVLLDELTPESLGALIALHEHKVFAQGIIWGINSFDQWGVELGKVLGDRIHAALSDDALHSAPADPTTQELVRLFRRAQAT